MTEETSLAFSFDDTTFTDFLPEDNKEQLYTRWADFNIHDPGVTTYEALQFAFQDLTYRFDLPIEVLLQGIKNNAFGSWSIHDLRTVYAVTPNDYRRVLATLKNVVNAVVYPCEEPNVSSGELSPSSLLTVQGVLRLTYYKACLNDRTLIKYRALGEYFNRDSGNKQFIDSLNVKLVNVKLNVTYKFQQETAVNKRKIKCALSDYLLPRLNNFNFRFLEDSQVLVESETFGAFTQAQGTSVIDENAILKPYYRRLIPVSEIYDVLQELSFLDSVNSVEIALNTGGRYTDAVLDLRKYCFTQLGELELNDVSYDETNKLEFCSVNTSALENIEEFSYNETRWHDLGKFYSVQETFPNNYGMGKNLMDQSSTELDASGNFRGYLYFMDQVRANVLAQMGKYHRIFSVNRDVCNVYSKSLKNDPYYKDLTISGKVCDDDSALSTNCSDLDIQNSFQESRLNYLLALNGWSTDQILPASTESASLLLIKREFLDLVHNADAYLSGINTDLNSIFQSKSLALLQEKIRIILQSKVEAVRILEHVFLQPVWDNEENLDFALTIFLFPKEGENLDKTFYSKYIQPIIEDFMPVHILYRVACQTESVDLFDHVLNEAFPSDTIFYFDNELTKNQKRAMLWLKIQSDSGYNYESED